MQPIDKIKLACRIIQKFKEINTLTIDYPFENKWLEHADDVSLMNTYHEITSDSYEPSPAERIDVPKAGGLIRHFSYLKLKDHLLYILIGIECFEVIYKITGGKYELPSDAVLMNYPVERNWMKKYIRGERDMMEMRRPLYNKGYASILTSDITAFAPNIDIAVLCGELIQAGVAADTVARLEKCLRKWSPLGHKGVPQVFFTTDLLTEFYLHPLDNYFRSMKESIYLRESDNIEIWCKSYSSSREKLMQLAEQLYSRGLYLNVFKTKIVNEKSLDKHEHPMEHKRYGLRMKLKKRYGGIMNLYYHLEERFMLNQCSTRLAKNPEFTVALLRHYSNSNIDISNSLYKFFTSGNAIYPYQNFAIIKWLSENFSRHHKGLLDIIREMSWNSNNPYYLKSAARHYIYNYGTITDRERLNNAISMTNDSLEREDLLSLISSHTEISAFRF